MRTSILFVYITAVLVLFIGGKIYTVHEDTLIRAEAYRFEQSVTAFMNKGDRFTGQDGRDMANRIDLLEERIMLLEANSGH